MLNTYTVSFFGHRQIEDVYEVEEELYHLIQKLMQEKEYVEFLVGCHGDFDRCVTSCIHRVRKTYREDNSSLTLVLPYLTAEYRDNEQAFHDYYTDVEISYAASKAHPKSAIQMRNREMVDRADLIVCYVKEKQGGAWQTMQYAVKQNKKVLHL